MGTEHWQNLPQRIRHWAEVKFGSIFMHEGDLRFGGGAKPPEYGRAVGCDKGHDLRVSRSLHD